MLGPMFSPACGVVSSALVSSIGVGEVKVVSLVEDTTIKFQGKGKRFAGNLSLLSPLVRKSMATVPCGFTLFVLVQLAQPLNGFWDHL